MTAAQGHGAAGSGGAPIQALTQRIRPPPGEFLKLAVIAGKWRSTSAIECVGVFAVCWKARRGYCYAALHDFEPVAQLKLIEQCREAERPTLVFPVRCA
jgi:hypothetical protein